MTQTPPQSPQPAPPDASEPVIAHGARRDEAHYEADPDQVVRVRHTFKPEGQLPPDEQSPSAGRQSADPPLQDVGVVKPSPSVWEALPEPDKDPPGA